MSTKKLADLIKADRKYLAGIENQEAFIAQIDNIKVECPICKKGCNRFEAASIDVATTTYAEAYPDDRELNYTCPQCKAPLKYVVPLFINLQPWFWQFNTERARAEGWIFRP